MFVDSLAPDEMTHAYAVASHSADGVVSELSTAVSIFTPDATPPIVFSVLPGEGATNVSGVGPIRVRFNERMDPASITPAAFEVRETASGALQSGTVTYDSTTRTASWTPAAQLPPERRISFSVTTAAKDAGGNSLAATHTVFFTTRENTAPYVVSFSPPSGSVLPMGIWPTVQFNERLRLTFFSTARGVRLIDFNPSSPNVLLDDAPFDTLTNVATLRPFKRVQSFRSYTVEVNDAALDLAGNPVEKRVTFTVQFGEWTLPDIATVFPADGATNAPTSGPVTLDLSAPILPVNDYDLRFDLRVTGSDKPAGTVVYSLYSNRITLSSTRQPNTSYTATFYHFFTDSKGVRREASRQWSFTTGP